jgi:hypothetical protein
MAVFGAAPSRALIQDSKAIEEHELVAASFDRGCKRRAGREAGVQN